MAHPALSGAAPAQSIPCKEVGMDKVRLNVEELRVQSFTTEETEDRQGTVHGREAAGPSALLSRCCQTNEFQSCPFRCTP
jgi:hypothetical protein